MKKILLILMSCLMIFSFSDCKNAKVEQEKKVKQEKAEKFYMFVVVETNSSWKVVYHKETKVMYAVSMGCYNAGTFTLLVDENGNPLLWEG